MYLQVKVDLQIFLFIIIFALTHQIEVYAWIMLFAFIHELGHMLAGVLLKLKPKSLSLMPFGVSVNFETYGYKKLIEKKKILIAISGPLTNLIICIITYFLNINQNTKEIIVYSNILIAAFNLIPLYPLDGGRILKGIIRLKCEEMKTDTYVNIISNVLMIILTVIASIIILYLKNIAILFLIIYLWIIEIKENKKYNLKKKTYDLLEKEKIYKER